MTGLIQVVEKVAEANCPSTKVDLLAHASNRIDTLRNWSP